MLWELKESKFFPILNTLEYLNETKQHSNANFPLNRIMWKYLSSQIGLLTKINVKSFNTLFIFHPPTKHTDSHWIAWVFRYGVAEFSFFYLVAPEWFYEFICMRHTFIFMELDVHALQACGIYKINSVILVLK